MQGVFFRNLILIVLVNLIIKPLWIFGIDRTVQNTVGPEEYGIYFVLTNLSLLTQILLDLGITNYNNRLLAQKEHLLGHHLSHLLGIKIILSGVYIGITLVIALVLDFKGDRLYLLALICVNQVLASLVIYVRSNLNALHRFKIDSLLSVLDKGIMIIVCGILLSIYSVKHHFRIEWFVYAQLFAYLLTLVTASAFLFRVSGKIRLRFSAPFTKDIMKQTFPFALLISLMMIYARIDGVMLEKILGEQGSREAGLYASAFRLIDAFNQFGYLFAVLLLPIFSRMISSGQKVEDLAKSSFTVIHAGAMIACSGTLFYASEIMDLLYHEPGEYPAAILRILIFTVLGSTATFVFSTLLTAANHLGILSGAAGFAAVVNFGLNLFLIPRNQALGAAEAAAVTQISLGAFHLLLAAYYFRFQVNYPLVIRFIVFAASCIFIFWMLHQAPISWYLSLAAGSAACLLVAFLVKVFEVNRMLSYIRADK